MSTGIVEFLNICRTSSTALPASSTNASALSPIFCSRIRQIPVSRRSRAESQSGNLRIKSPVWLTAMLPPA